MKVMIKKWNEVDIEDLARLTYASIQRSALKLESAKSVDSLENWLREQVFEPNSFAVVAYEQKKPVGWMMIVHQEDNRYIMNPWGMHPFVSPELDTIAVSKLLVQESINTAMQRGLTRFQFYANRSREASDGIHNTYLDLYTSLGIQVASVTVDMKLDLDKVKHDSGTLPHEYRLAKLEEFDEDTLYSCYYAAFEDESARFFSQQNEIEKRAFFDDLASMELDEESSLAIARDNELIGFSLTIPYREENLHLTCICIHPSSSGIGLGRFLLNEIVMTAKTEGYESMTLYTSKEIRAFELYSKNGWEVTETYTEYEWKTTQ